MITKLKNSFLVSLLIIGVVLIVSVLPLVTKYFFRLFLLMLENPLEVLAFFGLVGGCELVLRRGLENGAPFGGFLETLNFRLGVFISGDFPYRKNHTNYPLWGWYNGANLVSLSEGLYFGGFLLLKEYFRLSYRVPL